MPKVVAAVCKTTPKIKTNVDSTKRNWRLIRSTIGAAVKSPKNVPADRMENNSGCLGGGNVQVNNVVRGYH